jgi:outer membrane protein, heavy metal efflux system
MKRHGLFAALAATGIICGAWAQDAPSLTLPEALQRAARQRPELAALAIDQRVAEVRQSAAALRPVPRIDLNVEDALGTGTHAGFKAAETTLALSQALETGGKRQARINVAATERARLDTVLSLQQLDIAADVARRFIEVVREQQRQELAREAVRISEQAQQRVDERVLAARAPLAESSRAGVQLWNARLAFEDTEHELEIARRDLAAAMGEDAAAFGAAQGDLLTLPEPAPLADLLATLQQAPDLLRYADDARLREAQLRLAELQRRADITGSLGVRHIGNGNDVALVAGVSVPLFAGRQAEPQIAAARAARERVSVDRQTAWLHLQAQLHAAYLRLEHERHLSATIRTELLPRLQQALEQTALAYERGRYSYLEWSTAQRELLEGRLRLIESAANYHLLKVEIERLTGAPLPTVGEAP